MENNIKDVIYFMKVAKIPKWMIDLVEELVKENEKLKIQVEKEKWHDAKIETPPPNTYAYYIVTIKEGNRIWTEQRKWMGNEWGFSLFEQKHKKLEILFWRKMLEPPCR